MLWGWGVFCLLPRGDNFGFAQEQVHTNHSKRHKRVINTKTVESVWMNSSVFSMNYLTCFSISSYFISFVLLLQMWFVWRFLISKLELLFFCELRNTTLSKLIWWPKKQSSRCDFILEKKSTLQYLPSRICLTTPI